VGLKRYGVEITMTIRKPAVAGAFYPSDRKALAEMIESFLAKASPKDLTPKALIVPHAGYVYSGCVSAFGYKLLENLDQNTDYRIILIGPSHHVWFEGASMSEADAWETPLGIAKVERSDEIGDAFAMMPEAHQHEHSLEVQLPFLQCVMKRFNIVPIVTGEIYPETLAKKIIPLINDKTIVIASSDLSHYLDYETARKTDMLTSDIIQAIDTKRAESIDACGKTAIAALMHIARHMKWKCSLLDYKNSGDTAGGRKAVVGYGCYVFYE
jgi:AmmeMemoRadiSam system protein B